MEENSKIASKIFPQQNPVIEFKYNPPSQQPKPKYQPQPIDPTMFVPSFQNVPFFPSTLDYEFYKQHAIQNPQVPIIKNYNIEGLGPTGLNHSVAMVIEDSLPKGIYPDSTYQTLGERINLFEFIRSTIFNNSDGSDISLDGSGGRSILSYIKFDEINPYNKNRYTGNPFSELPDNYLICRSCYPIRRDAVRNSIMCAKDSTALNVRIYKMLEKSFHNVTDNSSEFINFAEWRELAYYEYVRENIIKPKVSPNFVLLYGYFISLKSGVNYSIINNMKNKIQQKKSNTEANKEYIIVNDEDVARKILNTKDDTISNPVKKGKTIVTNPEAYLGKSLVIITESPTYTLYSWASNIYLQEGTVKKMINRGIHTIEEWKNIYFQLLYSLYVMKKKNIYIKNFSIKNNVFIKDLVMKGQSTNYWKYVIEGIEFYIPNLGFLVQIDSNYMDKIQPSTLLYSKNQTDDKVGGDCVGDNTEHVDVIKKMFSFALDVNQYGKDFIQFGGCKPPQELLHLLENINRDILSQQDIPIVIAQHMSVYLHNRIGDYLKENEISSVRRDYIETLKRGNLGIIEESQNTYRVVILLDNVDGNGKVNILNDKYTKTNVDINSILYYSGDRLQQTIKANEVKLLSEDSLLEVYSI